MRIYMYIRMCIYVEVYVTCESRRIMAYGARFTVWHAWIKGKVYWAYVYVQICVRMSYVHVYMYVCIPVHVHAFI